MLTLLFTCQHPDLTESREKHRFLPHYLEKELAAIRQFNIKNWYAVS